MKEKIELLREFGLFLALLGIGVLTVWLQIYIPSTGGALMILGATIMFIANILEARERENKKTDY